MARLPILCGSCALLGLWLSTAISAQTTLPPVPNSYPHDYPGKPRGDFSPEWQNYYRVKDGSLPNVTFPLNRNWAGSIPVNRTNHPNDTLFFWAFEHKDGSLTSNATDEPWAIWLNGGPGASSLLGLLLENGPLLVTEDGSLHSNNASWANLVDYVWVDQPVGTGYSTAEADGGYIFDEDEMGADFLNFLRNLVKIFPNLATRPLLLTGESYAGTYIPYITKTIFSTPEPPVNLTKIAIGNGAIGSVTEIESLPALSLIETYPQLIGYDAEVYQYFRTQNHLCGYDFNLTYPQQGKFPPVRDPSILPTEEFRAITLAKQSSSLLKKRFHALIHSVEVPQAGIVRRDTIATRAEVEGREQKRRAWLAKKNSLLESRDLSGRPNGTIDPWYGCFLSAEVQDYALNFSMPWNLTQEVVISSLDDYGPYNVYNLEDARAPPLAVDPTTFLNDNRTRAALHAPTSKNWTLQINYPFNSSFTLINGSNPFGDPSVEPVAFLDELATNATERGVKVVIYVGNDDSVVPHVSSEISIQNTTFGGIQGFSRKPDTPWHDDSGKFAGVIHQERNWTYILVAKAGHEVPEYQPESGFVMFREFIMGNNQTGLLTNTSTTAIGGEDTSLLVGPNNILFGEDSILYGSGTRTSYYAAPSATIASWRSYFASVVASESAAAATATGGDRASSGSVVSFDRLRTWWIAASLGISIALSA